MATWTPAQEKRVQAIEEMLNNLQIGFNNLSSKAQMRQLLLIKQAEIDALTTRVGALETQVTALQSQV